jgi:hypothetical protein
MAHVPCTESHSNAKKTGAASAIHMFLQIASSASAIAWQLSTAATPAIDRTTTIFIDISVPLYLNMISTYQSHFEWSYVM